MKTLLLPVTLLAFCAMAEAGTDVVPLRSSGGVLRRNENMYRPIPKGLNVNPNASSSERARQTQYTPTQHYYLRENVVSYRYGAGPAARYAGTGFLGPKGALFTPAEEQMAPNAGVRNYAAVHKRPQPGVPMIQRAARVERTAAAETKSGESRIQLVAKR